jgi:hypothetical protein
MAIELSYFELTHEQVQQIGLPLTQASEADQKNQPGSVIAQIQTIDIAGTITVYCQSCFIPCDKARQIKAVINGNTCTQTQLLYYLRDNSTGNWWADGDQQTSDLRKARLFTIKGALRFSYRSVDHLWPKHLVDAQPAEKLEEFLYYYESYADDMETAHWQLAEAEQGER